MSVELSEASKTQSPFSYLYTSVARNHLGEIAAVILSTLISYGRLNVRELSTRSKIPLKLVKTSLVSLIQLNCIKYWRDESSKQYFYTFDESGILILLHSGDIISHIKSNYGEDSAEVIQNIIENGHIKVEDYLSNVGDEEEKYNKQNIFVKLYQAGWLVRLQGFDLNPLDDLWEKMYQGILKDTPRSATTSEIKRVNEAKEKTKVKFKDLLESGNLPGDIFTTESGIQKIRSHIIMKFNLSRFEKHLRTIALSEFAKSRIGILTAKVYEVALSIVEKNSPDLKYPFNEISGLINDPEEERQYISSIENELIDNKKITFNVRDLISKLPEEIDLRNSILTHNFLKPGKKRGFDFEHDVPTKKIKTENEEFEVSQTNDFESNTDNSDPHSLSLVQHHLKLLSSSSSIPFLVEMSAGNYYIPYISIVKLLKDFTYDTLIKTTLGISSLRVLKCLKSLKLADEKTLSNSVLLKEKTVRNEVYRLINMNVIEIQEVPRSADRAASKTFYLFRHKPTSAYNYLTHSLVFSMGEILTNIQSFKNDHKILLEKCEREDVKGHEEELLLESELKTLKELQVREINNVARFNRIKTLYNIFKF